MTLRLLFDDHGYPSILAGSGRRENLGLFALHPRTYREGL